MCFYPFTALFTFAVNPVIVYFDFCFVFRLMIFEQGEVQT